MSQYEFSIQKGDTRSSVFCTALYEGIARQAIVEAYARHGFMIGNEAASVGPPHAVANEIDASGVRV